MENQLDELINHVSWSQQQMARILEAQRHAAVRMAQIIQAMPATAAPLRSEDKEANNPVTMVNTSIASYLNAMADFQQTAAESLELVLKELRDGEAEE